MDQDGNVTITDAINILFAAFDPDSIRNPAVRDANMNCLAAFDVDGGNSLGISDAVRLLQWKFAGGREPTTPFPDCGLPPEDPAPDFVCRKYSCSE